MAIWQYDFIAIPRDELSNAIGGIPTAMTQEQYSTLNFWGTRQPEPGFEVEFSKWRPEIKSWSSDLRLWGTEESNRIDISYLNGRVSNIEFRIELRSISIHFLDIITKFVRINNCLLVSAHSLQLVDPLREKILMYFCRAPGANQVFDWVSGTTSEKTSLALPKVFLSHSSADKDFASRLAVDLQSRNVPVWFDKWELKVGDSLIQKIEEGISESGWLAVILSKNSISSDWVQKELYAAQAKELREKSVFILPIILDNCNVPLFLLDKVYADFRNSYDHGLEYLLNRFINGNEDISSVKIA
jgi:hypothetical protein